MKIASTAIALALALFVPTFSMANELTVKRTIQSPGKGSVSQTETQSAPAKPSKKTLKPRRQAPPGKAQDELDGSIEWLAPDMAKTLGTIE